MVAGVSLAIYDKNTNATNTIMAGEPSPLQWNIPNGNVIPLDFQFDLEKRLLNNLPVKDSVNIRDSINYIYKVKYVYREKQKDCKKSIADRTTARKIGKHPAAVTPDSLPENPITYCTLDREEQPSEIVDTSKVTSIQLTVDGKIVYSTDDNHSTGGGR